MFKVVGAANIVILCPLLHRQLFCVRGSSWRILAGRPVIQVLFKLLESEQSSKNWSFLSQIWGHDGHHIWHFRWNYDNHLVKVIWWSSCDDRINVKVFSNGNWIVELLIAFLSEQFFTWFSSSAHISVMTEFEAKLAWLCYSPFQSYIALSWGTN